MSASRAIVATLLFFVACRDRPRGAVAVSAAESHTAVLLADGRVWTWGQVATESRRRMRSPAPVPGVSDAIAVAAAPRATVVLSRSGTVSLVSHAADTETAEAVAGLTDVVRVEAGRTAAAAVRRDGAVFVFCVRSESCPVPEGIPRAIPGLSDVADVSVGDDGLLVIRRDGTAAAASFDGTSVERIEGLAAVVSVAAGGRYSAAVTSDGAAWLWDSRRPAPTRVASVTGAKRARAGARSFYFLLEDGRVLAGGDNRWGQLGRPSSGLLDDPVPLGTYAGVRDMAAGTAHTVVVTSDGRVEALGSNVEGQLARAAPEVVTRPQRLAGPRDVAAASLGYESSLFLGADGGVWTAGRNPDGQLGVGFWGAGVSPPVRLPGLPPAAAVSAGSTHALALLRDGTLRAWGRNDQGSLGDGSGEPKLAPVPVRGLTGVRAACAGGDVSFALGEDGALWRWGGPGADPDAADPRDDLVPRPVPGTRAFHSVSCNDADRSAVLLHDDTTVWQMSGDMPAPARVGRLNDVTAIATSDGHSLALDGAGRVWEWRGFETAPAVVATDATAIAAGSEHSVIRHADGTVWTWGRNTFGQLCDGTSVDSDRPVRIAHDAAGIAAGYESTLVIHADGTASACGWNQPRLGVSLAASHTPLAITLAREVP